MKENSPNFEIKFLSSHLHQNVEFFFVILKTIEFFHGENKRQRYVKYVAIYYILRRLAIKEAE